MMVRSGIVLRGPIDCRLGTEREGTQIRGRTRTVSTVDADR